MNSGRKKLKPGLIKPEPSTATQIIQKDLIPLFKIDTSTISNLALLKKLTEPYLRLIYSSERTETPLEESQKQEVRDAIQNLEKNPSEVDIFRSAIRSIQEMVIVATVENRAASDELKQWLKEFRYTRNWAYSGWVKYGKTERKFEYGAPRSFERFSENFKSIFTHFFAEIMELIGYSFESKAGKKSNGECFIGTCPWCEKIFVRKRLHNTFDTPSCKSQALRALKDPRIKGEARTTSLKDFMKLYDRRRRNKPLVPIKGE